MDLRKLAIPFVLLLVAGFGYFAFRYLKQPAQQVDDFSTVLNLRPGDLLMNCGQPAFNSVGLVGFSAGIQDLHYKPNETDEIVFRFITEDDKTWQSMGAWDRVNAVDALGTPVSSAAAIRRLPCAGKPSDRSSLFEQPGPWSASLATFLNPLGVEQMLAFAQQPNNDPWLVRAPPSGFKLPPPHANPFYDPEEALRHMRMPCPANMQPCLVVSFDEFKAGMGRVVGSERDGDFISALNRLTDRGTIVVRLPVQGQGRDAAVNGVVHQEVLAINLLAVALRNDILRLMPTSRDTNDQKTKKLNVLMHYEQVRRVLWKEAVNSNRPSAGVNTGAVNLLPFNTKAFQRMVEIHVTGLWP
jgi:hypothetical protein